MILTCSICDKGLGELSPDAPAREVSAAQKAGQYEGYARLREAPRSPVCSDCLGKGAGAGRGIGSLNPAVVTETLAGGGYVLRTGGVVYDRDDGAR